jgi:arsenate reductase-like glutaredoxin family protein
MKMTDEELYTWLDNCPAGWEEVQSFNGTRWIKFSNKYLVIFTVEEEEIIKFIPDFEIKKPEAKVIPFNKTIR